MREYKVVIIDKDTKKQLAVRVKDECNFLPGRPFKDKIIIDGEVYAFWEITYLIENDDWIQEIIVKNAASLKKYDTYDSIGGFTK